MRKLLVSLATLALATGACGGSETKTVTAKIPSGGPPVIKAQGTTWKPAEVTVKVGDKVTWVVEQGLIHDLSGEDGVEHEGATEFTYTHAYGTAGEYAYQCTLHKGMTGTVTVT